MPEKIVKVSEMNEAQQEQWSAILGLNRALLLDPTLIPYKDTLEPSIYNTARSRREEHAARGCSDGEVSILVKSSGNGSLAKFFTADGTIMPPENYERLEEPIAESIHGRIVIDLSHKPVRHGGEDKKTHKEILILDNTVNFYKTSIKKLINTENPHIAPVRGINEPYEQFLVGKNFDTVEEFVYSEDPDNIIQHSVAPYEYAGELNIGITLQRLEQYIGYVARSRAAVLETQPATNPARVPEPLSA
jgi:hypothetical protein